MLFPYLQIYGKFYFYFFQLFVCIYIYSAVCLLFFNLSRIHYLNHVKSEFGSKPEFVRAQYERSIEGCGKGKKFMP